jgi:hypothetical protein
MLAKQDVQPRSGLRSSSCSTCGRSVRINPLKCSDTDIVCKSCRCKRCSIPISPRPCDRCGIAHGTPSTEPGLCERCFATAIDHSDSPAVYESALPFAVWSKDSARTLNGGSIR